MPKASSRKNRKPATAADLRALQILLWCSVLLGPAIIFNGVHNNNRDRPSLQWPKAPGTILVSDWSYHRASKGGSYYTITVIYSYSVNGKSYRGSHPRLWDSDLHTGSKSKAKAFIDAHPHNAIVDVFYDPQNPDNAVLIPGADEDSNLFFIWDGVIVFVLTVFLTIRTWKKFPQKIAEAKATAARAARLPKDPDTSAAFVTYEPGSKRKLNYFHDRAALFDYLGRDRESSLQDWKPDDRALDAEGREYRLVNHPDGKRYGLESTGKTWTSDQLFEIAEADVRVIHHDPTPLRGKFNDAPPEQKMSVLLQGINHLSEQMSPKGWMAIIGLLLFLLLFFLAVMFGVGKLFSLLGK